MDKFLRKQIENGILGNDDVVGKGAYFLSGDNIWESIFKTILITVFNLGTVIRYKTPNPHIIAINKDRLVLFIYGQPCIFDRVVITGIEIIKQKGKRLIVRINFIEGEPIKLSVQPYSKKDTTLDQLRAALEQYPMAQIQQN